MYRKAFTLLEVLLVIALISVLLSILIRLINPEQQIGDINNAQRQADVLTIYAAINQYREANSGNLPLGIDGTEKSICKPNCTPDNDKIDISEAINPYIAFGTIPVDPRQAETLDTTGYKVRVNTEGRVVVTAPLAQNNSTINTLE